MKLLSYPSVIRQEVLVRMGFIDLLDLSTVSKKMRKVVKRDVKVRNHQIRLVYHRTHLQIHFLSMDGVIRECIWVCSYALLKDGDRGVRVFRKIGKFKGVVSKFFIRNGTRDQIPIRIPTLSTYWNTPFKGADELLKELMDIFLMKPKEVLIAMAATGLDHQAAVSWMNTLKDPLVRIVFFGDDRDSEVYEWILEQPMRSNEIHIESRSLTDEAIGNHLRSLKTGFHPNLKELNLKLYRVIDPGVILAELEFTEEENGWSFRLDNGERCMVRPADYGEGEVMEGVQISIERQ